MFRLGLRKLRRKTRQFLLRDRAGFGNGEKIVRGAIVGDRALGAEHLRAQILKPILEENLRALLRFGLRARLPRDIIVYQRIGDLRRLRRRMALVRDADRIGEPVALHRQPAEQGADRALAPDRVRSEERRVGNEWVSSCNSRWSQYS